jgi:hypothetical protein
VTSGGIPTKAIAFVALIAFVVLVAAPSAGQLPDLVVQNVHFEVPGHDLIPGIAAFRASCDVNASGEPLDLMDNETVRTTVAAVPGPCSMILVIFGFEAAIPTITTTPIGRSSYYLPGLTTITLGIVDVSLDLQTSLNSTTHVADPAAATVAREDVDWAAWGAQRLVVQGSHGFGSKAESALETTFHYSVSLGITIWIASVEWYHTGLADFGSYAGTPSLVTPITVDLLPHPLVLGPARDVTYQGATLNWTGTVDSDLDHRELWVTDGTSNVSYRITDRVASALSVPLKEDTTYEAWIVSVDGAGQASSSAIVTFRTLAAPSAPSTPNPGPPTYTEMQANIIVMGTFAFIAVLAALVAYGFGRTRGRM